MIRDKLCTMVVKTVFYPFTLLARVRVYMCVCVCVCLRARELVRVERVSVCESVSLDDLLLFFF